MGNVVEWLQDKTFTLHNWLWVVIVAATIVFAIIIISVNINSRKGGGKKVDEGDKPAESQPRKEESSSYSEPEPVYIEEPIPIEPDKADNAPTHDAAPVLIESSEEQEMKETKTEKKNGKTQTVTTKPVKEEKPADAKKSKAAPAKTEPVKAAPAKKEAAKATPVKSEKAAPAKKETAAPAKTSSAKTTKATVQEKPKKEAAKPVAKTEKAAPAKKEAAKPEKAAKSEDNKVYHISKRKEDRKWQVKAEGAEKALKLFFTQEEAIDYAKSVAGNQEGRIIIHKEDGSFRKLKY